MTLPRLLAPFAALLTLAACQAVPAPPPADLRDYTHVEVRRIGDYDQGHIEFHDRAMANAFAVMAEAGIAPDAAGRVTISTPPSQEEAGFGSNFGFVNYRLWIAVEGCDKNLLFVAGPGGNLRTSSDPGGCLARDG